MGLFLRRASYEKRLSLIITLRVPIVSPPCLASQIRGRSFPERQTSHKARQREGKLKDVRSFLDVMKGVRRPKWMRLLFDIDSRNEDMLRQVAVEHLVEAHASITKILR